MGFATRPHLNRHTRKYHAHVDNGASLLDEVRALKKRKHAEETARDQVQEQPITLFRPSRADIDTLLSLLPNMPESEVILRLKGNNSNVEQAIGKYFDKHVSGGEAEVSSD